MLKMIIADDEPLVRQTIARIIDWEQYGVRLLGTCKDGIETYNMILDESPDVVLLDISMPGMNGLDLIERIRLVDESVSFIIISGYDRFEFAQRAMQYGVCEYLLKPCNKDQILSAIRKIQQEKERLGTVHMLQQENTLLQQRVQDAIQARFLSDVFRPGSDTDSRIEEYSRLVESPQLCQATIYLAHTCGKDPRDLIIRIYEHLEQFTVRLFFDIMAVENVIILTLSGQDPHQIALARDALASLDKNVVSCTLKYYPTVCSALRALIPELQLCDRVDQYTRAGECRELYSTVAIEEEITEEGCRLMQEFPRMSDQEQDASLSRLFAKVCSSDMAKTISTKILYRQLPSCTSGLSAGVAQLVSGIYACTGVSDVQAMLKQGLRQLLADNSEKDSSRDYIQQAIAYVQSHLSSPNLSLKWIAENVLYMNSNYISKQFQQDQGEKFSVFLTRCRMELAKKLLVQNASVKITDVAEAVGLGGNPQYFSQVFRKYTGMTPSQYLAEHSR